MKVTRWTYSHKETDANLGIIARNDSAAEKVKDKIVKNPSDWMALKEEQIDRSAAPSSEKEAFLIDSAGKSWSKEELLELIEAVLKHKEADETFSYYFGDGK